MIQYERALREGKQEKETVFNRLAEQVVYQNTEMRIL
jgi:hypothetical protein